MTNEVLEAIREYCSQSGRSLPDNGLIEFHNSRVRVTLKSTEGESVVQFSQSEVGAVLIMFCVRKSIPIRRHIAADLSRRRVASRGKYVVRAITPAASRTLGMRLSRDPSA